MTHPNMTYYQDISPPFSTFTFYDFGPLKAINFVITPIIKSHTN